MKDLMWDIAVGVVIVTTLTVIMHLISFEVMVLGALSSILLKGIIDG